MVHSLKGFMQQPQVLMVLSPKEVVGGITQLPLGILVHLHKVNLVNQVGGKVLSHKGFPLLPLVLQVLLLKVSLQRHQEAMAHLLKVQMPLQLLTMVHSRKEMV